MDKVTLHNFRCFANVQDIPLRPLTLLVGENSTGKSSFLAGLRLASDLKQGIRRLDFNEEPFLLGAYDQIAHYRGGRAGRAQTFEIGIEERVEDPRHSTPDATLTLSHRATFNKDGSHPSIARQELAFGDYCLIISFQTADLRPKLQIRTGVRTTERTLDVQTAQIRLSSETPVDWSFVLYGLLDFRRQVHSMKESPTDLSKEDLSQVETAIMANRYSRQGRPAAIAPVRTRPQRTYNPVSEVPIPEGAHVPMVLAKTFFSEKERWQRLKVQLDAFGKSSGLFDAIEIRPLGRHESDPFQIEIKINGPKSNIVDVGYGISQALPILVDSLLGQGDSLYLMQQPEVHLHPRAQAELGTFFSRIVTATKKRFVIETHSDYLVDRVRMEIREGHSISPDQAIILFFERQKLDVVIHPIPIDSRGELHDVPSSFRKFFLREQRRLLGI